MSQPTFEGRWWIFWTSILGGPPRPSIVEGNEAQPAQMPPKDSRVLSGQTVLLHKALIKSEHDGLSPGEIATLYPLPAGIEPPTLVSGAV